MEKFEPTEPIIPKGDAEKTPAQSSQESVEKMRDKVLKIGLHYNWQTDPRKEVKHCEWLGYAGPFSNDEDAKKWQDSFEEVLKKNGYYASLEIIPRPTELNIYPSNEDMVFNPHYLNELMGPEWVLQSIYDNLERGLPSYGKSFPE